MAESGAEMPPIGLRIGVRFPRWLWFLIGFRWMETWVEFHGQKLVPADARLVNGGVECDYQIPSIQETNG